MKNISEKEFMTLKKTHQFYKLEMEFDVPLKEELQFFGTEIGNDVLVVTIFNADICSSFHKVKNAEIGQWNGKYVVIEKEASEVSMPPKSEVIETPSIKNSLDDLIDEAIGGAVADTTIKVSVVPPTTPSDAKEEAKQSVEKQVVEKTEVVVEEKKQQKAQEAQVTGSPIITKGKQSETKPADKKPPVLNFKLDEPAPKKPVEKPVEKKQEKQKTSTKVDLAETISKAKKEKYDPWSGSGW
ncbi:MAG: hypothetical protein SPF22_08415 [Candidatus Onthovivens sp.]|nr:hypothetical protein [Candidatus Onthovivens sp.]